MFQIYLPFDSAIQLLRLCHSEISIEAHKDILANKNINNNINTF